MVDHIYLKKQSGKDMLPDEAKMVEKATKERNQQISQREKHGKQCALDKSAFVEEFQSEGFCESFFVDENDRLFRAVPDAEKLFEQYPF